MNLRRNKIILIDPRRITKDNSGLTVRNRGCRRRICRGHCGHRHFTANVDDCLFSFQRHDIRPCEHICLAAGNQRVKLGAVVKLKRIAFGSAAKLYNSGGRITVKTAPDLLVHIVPASSRTLFAPFTEMMLRILRQLRPIPFKSKLFRGLLFNGDHLRLKRNLLWCRIERPDNFFCRGCGIIRAKKQHSLALLVQDKRPGRTDCWQTISRTLLFFIIRHRRVNSCHTRQQRQGCCHILGIGKVKIHHMQPGKAALHICPGSDKHNAVTAFDCQPAKAGHNSQGRRKISFIQRQADPAMNGITDSNRHPADCPE